MPGASGLKRYVLGDRTPLIDAVIALVIGGLALKMAAGSYPADPAIREFDAFAVLLTIVANGAVLFRTRAPMTVLLITEAAVLTYEACGYWLQLNQLGPQFALATVASLRSWRWTLAAAAITLPALLYSNLHTWSGSNVDIIALSLVWLVMICIIGDAFRRLKHYSRVAAEHAHQLRSEQHEREQRAVLLERVRLARELHDIVAHHMSVVSVQAGLARYVLHSDPSTAEASLRAIAEMSSEALEEVRRLVTVLRPDSGPENGQECDRDTPGVADLPMLIERVGLTGVAIEFDVHGEVQPLTTGAALCVYRVVQESLTNAMKHAPGARVTVGLEYTPGQVRVRITNDARRLAPDPAVVAPLPSGGKGIAGMYERALLYGGTLTAGGLPGGGFDVVLTLPIRPAAPEADRLPAGGVGVAS